MMRHQLLLSLHRQVDKKDAQALIRDECQPPEDLREETAKWLDWLYLRTCTSKTRDFGKLAYWQGKPSGNLRQLKVQ